MRTAARLAECGGNLHYERFLSEVLGKLRGEPFYYRRFNCRLARLDDEPVFVDTKKPVFIEGCYVMRYEFCPYYNMTVFADVSPSEQKKRILARGGTDALKVFTERWIPLEEAYFAGFSVKERCSLTVELK